MRRSDLPAEAALRSRKLPDRLVRGVAARSRQGGLRPCVRVPRRASPARVACDPPKAAPLRPTAAAGRWPDDTPDSAGIRRPSPGDCAYRSHWIGSLRPCFGSARSANCSVQASRRSNACDPRGNFQNQICTLDVSPDGAQRRSATGSTIRPEKGCMMTIDPARTLVEALDRAGFEPRDRDRLLGVSLPGARWRPAQPHRRDGR